MKSKRRLMWLVKFSICLSALVVLIAVPNKFVVASSSSLLPAGVFFEMDQPSHGHVEIFTIEIPQLGDRERNIQVYLPPGYESSSESYPVFYLTDGEYLFNPPVGGTGDYAVDETLEKLFREGVLDPIIVVGIEHPLEIPWSEYTPWINENMHAWINPKHADPDEGGEGWAFIDFLVNTLKPEIDANYRTLPGREFTAIGGFCRGGLIPLLAGFKYPGSFSKVMSMSPVVWLAEGGGTWLSNNHLINYIHDNPMPDNVKFYIDVGTEEVSGNRPAIQDAKGKRITYPQAYLEGAQALHQALLNNQVPESNLHFQVIEGAPGDRDEWAQRFDEAVVWLYNEEALEKVESMTIPETPKVEKVEKESSEKTQPIIKRTPLQQLTDLIKTKFSSWKLVGIFAGGFVLLACFVLFVSIKRKF